MDFTNEKEIKSPFYVLQHKINKIKMLCIISYIPKQI